MPGVGAAFLYRDSLDDVVETVYLLLDDLPGPAQTLVVQSLCLSPVHLLDVGISHVDPGILALAALHDFFDGQPQSQAPYGCASCEDCAPPPANQASRLTTGFTGDLPGVGKVIGLYPAPSGLGAGVGLVFRVILLPVGEVVGCPGLRVHPPESAPAVGLQVLPGIGWAQLIPVVQEAPKTATTASATGWRGVGSRWWGPCSWRRGISRWRSPGRRVWSVTRRRSPPFQHRCWALPAVCWGPARQMVPTRGACIPP